MADGTHDIHQEYWRPLNSSRNLNFDPVQRAAICRCGTEYLLGARYCHICGAERDPNVDWKTSPRQVSTWMSFDILRGLTGLGPAALVFFLVGVLCGLAVLFVGSGETADPIQVTQMWRLELLLGSAVAFLAAIALKRGSE